MRTGADSSQNFRSNGKRADANNAFARTPQAKDDQYNMMAAMDGDGDPTYILDVMANDSGGKAKSLWSLDDGIGSGGSGRSDLSIRDIAGVAESSALGAQIAKTEDGKVSYTVTPELRDQLLPLSAHESLTDTFTYAIQMGNGVLSWATATVEIAGVNDSPVLSEPIALLADAEANHEYMIFEKDLLAGFFDPDGDQLSVTDLTATNGSLAETMGGWFFYPDTDFTGTVELHYNVIDAHGGSISASQDFMVMDTMMPELVSSIPLDEGNLKVDQNIVLDFNEQVVPGSGSIIISNGSDIRTIDINDTSQVTVTSGKKGGTVIIDPTDDLILDTNYSIQMTSGAILDMSGNAYEGINDPEILDFMTIPSNPLLDWSYPGAEEVLKADNNIELYFDESVVAGSGEIIISNGTDTRTIDINDTSQVTFDGFDSVIINPIDDLVPDTVYNIQVASGVILDEDGFAYAGISDPEALDFMVIPSDPLLGWSNLWYEGILKADNSIELYFDEPVVAGSGEIIISNGSDTRTIDINDTSQVTFDDFDGVIINPIDDLVPGTVYNIQMASGVILDDDGFAYAGIHDAETLNFNVITASPLLIYSDPMDEFTEFQVDSHIYLAFDEMVVAGSGAIIISNGTDTRTIDVNDTSQVIFDGYSGVTINPADDLIPNTTYNIQMTSGVIADPEGHAYEGINNPGTLNFTAIPSNPVLEWSYPQDESIFKMDDSISLYFNEMIIPGSGNIVISNGADTRTIDVRDTSQVMFDGYGGVMIDPADDLIFDENYHILIDGGAITDMAGNPYVGVGDPDILNFTTISSEPLISAFLAEEYVSKIDDDIWIDFDEAVTPGTGAIVLSNGTDTRIIDISDTSQVTFSGGKVTINPIDDLIVDTQYNIQMAAGVILDTDGNEFAGISDPDTYSFSTISSDPRLLFSYPEDDLTNVWVGSDIHLYFDESVKAGSGNVIISNGTDIHTIDIQDSSQVMFDDYGGGVFINPASDLIPNTDYHILIDSGAITDMEGNPYAGINDETTLNFFTTDVDPFFHMMFPLLPI